MASEVRQSQVADEHALARAAHSGDVQAFNQLVQLHQALAYNLAYRVLGDAGRAAAVTQGAFLSAYCGMGRLRDRPFKIAVLRLVAQACQKELGRDGHRSSTNAGTGSQARVSQGLGKAEVISRHRERQERDRLVQAGILRLPVEERIVLVLSDVNGLSRLEVAQITGLPPGAVRARLDRARIRLRDYITGT